MAVKTKKFNNITWINIIEPDNNDIKFLVDNYKFHPLDIKDVKGEFQRSKIDVYNNYAFIILRFPVTYKDSNLIGSHELDIFLGKDYVITIQKKRIKSLNQFFYRVGTNKKLQKEIFNGKAALLLYHILDNLYRASFNIIDWLAREINRIEKAVFEEGTKKIVKDLAQARRNVLAFRAMMDPQRSVFKRIVILKKDYLSTDLANYFDDINDFIGRIYTNLTNLKELISGLHETNESLSSYRLNKVMKVLAIFSVAMLPLTLLTGIYGMNLSNLPLIHNESLVWYIFGGVAIIIIALFAYFKHKDII
ncbi:magnesium transporter CorA family protein [bacterium]|jgi:magnesium transporter|nr:magnesium transporter CorA family protein [bacterium]MBT4121335.1 magnesium transporter CorA family protein [bacterium]MBT4335403.1 magnesium transporter CorA family protein [bacterium]MBT4495812.1 magnesium transporter CorA family protein [bacterium]MBT4764356.1 magnesium transporter CorA family protein [bacterium]